MKNILLIFSVLLTSINSFSQCQKYYIQEEFQNNAWFPLLSAIYNGGDNILDSDDYILSCINLNNSICESPVPCNIQIGDYLKGWTRTVDVKHKSSFHSANELFGFEVISGDLQIPLFRGLIVIYEPLKKLMIAEIDRYGKLTGIKDVFTYYTDEDIAGEKMLCESFLESIDSKSYEETIDFINNLNFNRKWIENEIDKKGIYKDLFTGDIDRTILYSELIEKNIIQPNNTYSITLVNENDTIWRLSVNDRTYNTKLTPKKGFITCRKVESLSIETKDFDNQDFKGFVGSKLLWKSRTNPKYGDLYFFSVTNKKGKNLLKYGYGEVVFDRNIDGVEIKGFESKRNKFKSFEYIELAGMDEELGMYECYPINSIPVIGDPKRKKIYLPNTKIRYKLRPISGFE